MDRALPHDGRSAAPVAPCRCAGKTRLRPTALQGAVGSSRSACSMAAAASSCLPCCSRTCANLRNGRIWVGLRAICSRQVTSGATPSSIDTNAGSPAAPTTRIARKPTASTHQTSSIATIVPIDQHRAGRKRRALRVQRFRVHRVRGERDRGGVRRWRPPCRLLRQQRLEAGDRPRQPLVELDLRLPTQVLARQRDVRLPLRRIVRRHRLFHDRGARAEEAGAAGDEDLLAGIVVTHSRPGKRGHGRFSCHSAVEREDRGIKNGV